MIIDGKIVSAKVRGEVAAEAAELRKLGVNPGLAVVLVGEDPASQVYVRNKGKAAGEVGIQVFDHKLDASTSEPELFKLIDQLNADPAVHGILVQFPVPKQIHAAKIQARISPDKDVDGLHPLSAGLLWAGSLASFPARRSARCVFLKEAQTPLSGAHAVVLGRSTSSVSPWPRCSSKRTARSPCATRRPRDLPEVVRQADIVIAAIGRAEMVRGDWIKEGATVIDVGMNRNAQGKLCGDVHFAEAQPRARAITPVPGGVGPMTIALLSVEYRGLGAL